MQKTIHLFPETNVNHGLKILCAFRASQLAYYVFQKMDLFYDFSY